MLGHTKLILWMTDSQQKKTSRAIFFTSPKNQAGEKATFFPAKIGRVKKQIFFFKERNVTLT